MKDNVKISGEKVLTKTNLTIFAFGFSFMFQIGYFLTLGIEVFSYMTLNKVVLHTGVLVPFFALSIFLVLDLWEYIANHIENGGDFWSIGIVKFVENPLKTFSRISTIIGAVILVSAIFLSVYFFGWLPVVQIIIKLILTYMFLFLWLALIFNLGLLRKQLDDENEAERSQLISVVVFSIIVSFLTGLIYGTTIAGDKCTVSFDGGDMDITFFMSVDGAIIGKQNDSTVVLNKDYVNILTCPPVSNVPEPTSPEDSPP